MRFQLSQVSVRFAAQTALSNVLLSIGPEECVALVGPSGAGKTTLLRVLALAERPSSGALAIDGQPAVPTRKLRSRVGFIHQDLALVPNLSALQNVLMGAAGRQSTLGSLKSVFLPSDEETERVHALLDSVGIEDKLYQRVDSLSGGEAQRVAIARALYQEPGVLLADEPISAVDPTRGREVLELLLALGREHRIPVVVSLHRVELACELFPRVIGMREGRIVFDGRPDAHELAGLYAL
ncbi:MAG: ATP-binding cassette domain-containing protein [Proteobacteria bacterium]|nr:ATP-binding cassette domain-containing protein [Pseudomonadota bacterium]MCP4921524.1 ATP-binding cassette domain-containing protein [Pseudomonadota bacterium]